MIRPIVLPCSELGFCVLKSVPSTGNLCRVLVTVLPSDFCPMNPRIVVTASSSGKIAVNPYQAKASTCRLALSSLNFLFTAKGTPAHRCRRCHASMAPMTCRSLSMPGDFTEVAGAGNPRAPGLVADHVRLQPMHVCIACNSAAGRPAHQAEGGAVDYRRPRARRAA